MLCCCCGWRVGSAVACARGNTTTTHQHKHTTPVICERVPKERRSQKKNGRVGGGPDVNAISTVTARVCGSVAAVALAPGGLRCSPFRNSQDRSLRRAPSAASARQEKETARRPLAAEAPLRRWACQPLRMRRAASSTSRCMVELISDTYPTAAQTQTVTRALLY